MTLVCGWLHLLGRARGNPSRKRLPVPFRRFDLVGVLRRESLKRDLDLARCNLGRDGLVAELPIDSAREQVAAVNHGRSNRTICLDDAMSAFHPKLPFA